MAGEAAGKVVLDKGGSLEDAASAAADAVRMEGGSVEAQAAAAEATLEKNGATKEEVRLGGEGAARIGEVQASEMALLKAAHLCMALLRPRTLTRILMGRNAPWQRVRVPWKRLWKVDPHERRLWYSPQRRWPQL